MQTITSKHPGRPRQFDTQEVLRIAQDLFWEKGYKGTSMSDLIDATGLHKGSIYKAFGDKKQLYLLVLETYMDDMFNETVELAQKYDSPISALSAVLFQMIESTSGEDSGCAKGCMAINTIIQLSDDDSEIKALIERYYQKRFNALVELIEDGQKVSEITLSKPSTLLAMMTMTFMAGLAATVKSQTGINQKTLISEFIEVIIKP